ncbi:MAG: hypothetical protein JWM80_736 [Cyanobacteria bacterium RYN_339]|nr:hypothetical protein [Cyanobacteria bacterium RYN_339]
MSRSLAWPLLALVAALAGVYGPYLAAGGLLAVNDGLGYYFPVRALAALSLKAGELPFWNPFGFAGVPLHGMLQAGVFYPLNWTFLVLPPVAAMNVDVLASSLIAGGSMLLFTRALGLGRLAGLAAALPYMLAGYHMAHLEQLTSVQVTSLIPGVLWAVERFRQTLAPRWALTFCGLYALQLLAGYPQTSLFTLLIAWAYGWYRGRDLEAAPWRIYMLQLGLAGALGLGLAAVELLPVVEVIRQSSRLALTYGEIIDHSLPIHQLPMLLFPFLFGGPRTGIYTVPYWGAGPYMIELQGYAGLAPWALALAALPFLRADRRVRFFVALALVGGLLALGGNTPLFKLWAQLPILHSIRVPGRHVLELDLAMCLLAALGLQHLLDAAPERRRRLAALGAGGLGLAMAVVVAVVGLGRPAIVARLGPWMPPSMDLHQYLSLAQPNFWVPLLLYTATAAALALLAWRPRLGAVALLAVLFVDVASFARTSYWYALGVLPGARPGELTTRLPSSPYRSLSVVPYVPMFNVTRARAMHAPLLNVFDGERSASGYEAFVPQRYSTLLGGIDNMGLYHKTGPFVPPNHVLDILGVRTAYVVPPADERTSPATAGWRRGPDQGDIQVYENPHPQPRAWRVIQATALPADQVDRLVTGEPTFDPAREALLEDAPAPGGLTPGNAAVEAISPNRLRVTTDGPGPGLVLVSERFEPGWQATTPEGAHLPVALADGLVIAVAVPAGAQRFELRYRPPGWDAMVALSLASLAACAVWAWWGRRRRPTAP